jgi:Mn-dependent DtxR family transcriptional regulator
MAESEHIQEYLEAILRLVQLHEQQSEQGEPASDGTDVTWVTNNEIANRLSIKPPSVTEMLDKLQKEGLIEWQKRRGVRLTETGFNLASHVLDVHFLLEKFFTEVLELEDRALMHRLACAIEHDLISEPKLEEALRRSIEKVEVLKANQ